MTPFNPSYILKALPSERVTLGAGASAFGFAGDTVQSIAGREREGARWELGACSDLARNPHRVTFTAVPPGPEPAGTARPLGEDPRGLREGLGATG